MEKSKSGQIWPKRLWLPIVVIIAITMVMAAALPSVMAGKPNKPPVTNDFNLTILDSRKDVGRFPRIAVGPDYATHITYYDSTNHALKYATNKGGTWALSTLAIAGPTYGVADLALDAAGNVHIMYVDINNQLQFIDNAAGRWSDPIWFGEDIDVMGQPCMAIDSQGMFHVCFWQSDLDGNWITYSYGLPGDMSSTQVVYGDNTQTYSWEMSMSVDSNCVAHMIYNDIDSHVLTYTNSLDWSKNKITISGVAYWANMAIGQGNSVHLSYFTYPNMVLNYALLTGSSFASTVVEDAADLGAHHSAIAVDSNGYVHISYMDNPSDSRGSIIKYATNSGGTWVIKIVDGSSNAGAENGIAVGPGAKVHIAYYSPSSSDLKYAESV